jgi:hypothetical protein
MVGASSLQELPSPRNVVTKADNELILRSDVITSKYFAVSYLFYLAGGSVIIICSLIGVLFWKLQVNRHLLYLQSVYSMAVTWFQNVLSSCL